ncbi:hypothetical protein N7G274_006378 [Stereocaulon virgatum]|uniref:HAD-like protein n=1 Tax=Stereocaulon virgatum TaxID=373712 RepID=A0ABR4A770_9LECA
MATQTPQPPPTLPPVRACIFDLDGLLINSEDIYTDIYNNILHAYGRPSLPWSIKAKLQSTGRSGFLQLLDWAQLPISGDEFLAQITAQYDLFRRSKPLPGVPELLSTLSTKTSPKVHIAIASSSTARAFGIKTSHLPSITKHVSEECRVFGDDPQMSDAKKKPMPDIFLLALGRINKSLGPGEREVKAEECLVFEDSVAGVEAGRRAGMRVVWCPHVGLRGLLRGREEVVLEGRSAGVEEGKGEMGGKGGEGEKRLWSRDGWAEMRMSLEGFDYEHYGICLE